MFFQFPSMPFPRSRKPLPAVKATRTSSLYFTSQTTYFIEKYESSLLSQEISYSQKDYSISSLRVALAISASSGTVSASERLRKLQSVILTSRRRRLMLRVCFSTISELPREKAIVANDDYSKRPHEAAPGAGFRQVSERNC